MSDDLGPRQEMRAKVIKILAHHYNGAISIGAVEDILDATGLKDIENHVCQRGFGGIAGACIICGKELGENNV